MPFSTEPRDPTVPHLTDVDQDKTPALVRFSDGDVWEMPAGLKYEHDNFEEPPGVVAQVRIKVSHPPTTGPGGKFVRYPHPVWLCPGQTKEYVRAVITRLEKKV